MLAHTSGTHRMSYRRGVPVFYRMSGSALHPDKVVEPTESQNSILIHILTKVVKRVPHKAGLGECVVVPPGTDSVLRSKTARFCEN